MLVTFLLNSKRLQIAKTHGTPFSTPDGSEASGSRPSCGHRISTAAAQPNEPPTPPQEVWFLQAGVQGAV